LQFTENGDTLAEGSHSFKFSFQLPWDIPSSVEVDEGYVVYSIKIIVKKSLFSIDQKKTIRLSVNNLYDLNADTEANVSPRLF